MKSFLLLALLFGTTAAVQRPRVAPTFGPSNDVDDIIVEGSKAFSLLLPAVALPYAVALIAVLVPLVKAFILGVMNVFNLPFEVLLVLYFLLYVAMFTFPQLESLVKVTSVFAARSESARAARAAEEPQFPAVETVMDWTRNFVPESWLAAIMSPADPVVTTSEATTMEGASTTSATTEPASSTTWTSAASTTEVSSPLTSQTSAAATSTKRVVSSRTPSMASKCSSFPVCSSVSRLVKDYPVSGIVLSYLSNYLKGLKHERAVREGMAGLNCTSIYLHCMV